MRKQPKTPGEIRGSSAVELVEANFVSVRSQSKDGLNPQPAPFPYPKRSAEPSIDALRSKLASAERMMGEDSVLAQRARQKLHRAERAVATESRDVAASALERDKWSHRGGSKPAGLSLRVSATPRERADDQGEARGLVKAAYLHVYDNGRCVEVELPGMPPSHAIKRGECDGMSEDSRRRLLNFLQRIRRDAPLPTLVSLTFPAELTVTAAEAKACRRAWAERVKRRYGQWCALWRLEAHPELSAKLGRMHPHFHLLTWGAWYDLDWVSKTWTEVVWSVLKVDKFLADESGVLVRGKHRSAGTNCERIRTWSGVPYVVKTYIGKEEEYPLGKAGRVWGWDLRRLLPIAEVRKVELTNLQVVAVKRRIGEWMASKGINSEYLIRTIYCDTPTALAASLLAPTTWQREKEYHDSRTFIDET